MCARVKSSETSKAVAVAPKIKVPKIKTPKATATPLPDSIRLKIENISIFADKEMLKRDLIDFVVTFNKEVYTKGKPRLKIQAKGSLGFANYYTGEKTNRLRFRHQHSFEIENVKTIKVFIPNNEQDFNVSDKFGKIVYLENRLFEIPSNLSDTKSPEIVSIKPQEIKTYDIGEEILVNVEFDEDVMVSGRPFINLKLDKKQVRADLVENRSRKILTFSYKVEKGDYAENGIEIVGRLILNDAKIFDLSDNHFINKHADQFFRNLKINKELTKIVNIIMPGNRTYFDKESLNFKLIFDKALKVTGSPKLRIKIGKQIKLVPIKLVKENILTFEYTVGKGDFDDDGITVFPKITYEDGASITDESGVEVEDSFYFYEGSGIKVNSGKANIVKVTPPSSSFMKQGDTLSVSMDFDKPVKVTGKPWITAKLGGVEKRLFYTGGETTQKMIFNYVISEKDDGKGLLIRSPVRATEGQITNLNGNIPNLNFNDVNLSEFEVDTKGPRITSVNYPREEKFIYRDVIQFVIHYNEPVLITGEPRIRLSMASGEVFAQYLKGHGTRELTFNYIVHPTDKDLLGLTLIPPVELLDSAIVDKAGNQAQTDFKEVRMKTSSVDGTVGYKLATSGGIYNRKVKDGLKNVDNLFSNLTFETEFSNVRIESRDIEDNATANLTSSLIAGVYGTLSTRWSPLWITELKLGARKIEFEEASNFTILKLSNNYYTLNISTKYLLSDRIGLFFSAGMEQRPYVHARGTNILLIDPLSVINSQLGVNAHLWNYGTLSFGSSFAVKYLLGKTTDNFVLKNGLGAHAMLYVENFNRESKMRANIFVDFARQNSSITEQSNREVGLSFMYMIPFGENPFFL